MLQAHWQEPFTLPCLQEHWLNSQLGGSRARVASGPQSPRLLHLLSSTMETSSRNLSGGCKHLVRPQKQKPRNALALLSLHGKLGKPADASSAEVSFVVPEIIHSFICQTSEQAVLHAL